MSAPLILGFDTSGPYCAAALMRGDAVLADRLEPMTRGQAERLMGLLEEVLTEGDATLGDLSALGVGIGPGNFTGIRIAVSAARGLALGLGIPAVGVTGLEARARLTRNGAPAVPAPRDHVYIDGPDLPRLIPLAEAEAALGPIDATPAPDGIARAIAEVAATRWQGTPPPPAPLYVRAADAAPSRDVPPPLLDA